MSLSRNYDANAHLVQDVMRIILEKISVFDLPSFILTSRWFADQAEKLWEHHTRRIFDERPPRLFPDELHNPFPHLRLSWHGLFFKRYTRSTDTYPRTFDVNRHLRRPALRIQEEDIDTLIDEHRLGSYLVEGPGYRDRKDWKPFTIKDIFKETHDQPSLFQLAHAATKPAKKKLLDYFHEALVLPQVTIKSFDKQIPLPQPTQNLLRNALNIPNLSFDHLNYLSEYLLTTIASGMGNYPLILAIKNYKPILIVLLLQCEANLHETNDRGEVASALLIDMIAESLNGSLTINNSVDRLGERELIEYCLSHHPDIFDKATRKCCDVPATPVLGSRISM